MLRVPYTYRWLLLLSLGALFLTNSLAAIEADISLNGSGFLWKPDYISREKKLIQQPYPIYEAGDLKNTSGLGDYLLLMKLRDEPGQFEFYGVYSQARLKSSYEEIDYFMNFLQPGLNVPVDATFRRADVNLGFIYYLFPGFFGMGLGLRQMSEETVTSRLDLLSLSRHQAQHLSRTRGLEAVFQFMTEDPGSVKMDFGIKLFGTRGPYSYRSLLTAYETDINDFQILRKNITYNFSNPDVYMIKSGGEFSVNTQTPLADNISLTVGINMIFTQVSIKNYSSNLVFISSDPLYQDSLFLSLVNSFNWLYDEFVYGPIYRRKFSNNYFQFYGGVGVSF